MKKEIITLSYDVHRSSFPNNPVVSVDVGNNHNHTIYATLWESYEDSFRSPKPLIITEELVPLMLSYGYVPILISRKEISEELNDTKHGIASLHYKNIAYTQTLEPIDNQVFMGQIIFEQSLNDFYYGFLQRENNESINLYRVDKPLHITYSDIYHSADKLDNIIIGPFQDILKNRNFISTLDENPNII